jgi:hypothetical protein
VGHAQCAGEAVSHLAAVHASNQVESPPHSFK